MPKLQCPVCEKEWEIPGRILGYEYITHYPRVWCPHHNGLVGWAKIIQKEPYVTKPKKEKAQKPSKKKAQVIKKEEPEVSVDEVKEELQKKIVSIEEKLEDLMQNAKEFHRIYSEDEG